MFATASGCGPPLCSRALTQAILSFWPICLAVQEEAPSGQGHTACIDAMPPPRAVGRHRLGREGGNWSSDTLLPIRCGGSICRGRWPRRRSEFWGLSLKCQYPKGLALPPSTTLLASLSCSECIKASRGLRAHFSSGLSLCCRILPCLHLNLLRDRGHGYPALFPQFLGQAIQSLHGDTEAPFCTICELAFMNRADAALVLSQRKARAHTQVYLVL